VRYTRSASGPILTSKPDPIVIEQVPTHFMYLHFG
jgi:hypothetical protein